MSLYEDQFSETLNVSGVPTRTLVIASTPRSGSHMLGHSMIETGAMGRPFEYCNPANLKRWQNMFGTKGLRDTLQRLMEARTTPNGVFAIKLHLNHFNSLGGLEAIDEIFPAPKVIRILRGNILKQAVSITMAQQTGVWISGQRSNGLKPRYSYGKIRHNLSGLAMDNAMWDETLAGREVLTVEFTQVASDTGRVLRDIAEFAGIDLDPGSLPERPPTKAQATSLSDEWVHRYRARLKWERKYYRAVSLPRRIRLRLQKDG